MSKFQAKLKTKLKKELKERTQKTLDQTLLALKHPVLDEMKNKVSKAYTKGVELSPAELRAVVMDSILERAKEVRSQIDTQDPIGSFRKVATMAKAQIKKRVTKKSMF